ncbi:hypothetical protein EH220_02985 [bacterium]|nr:MAG: hypothetical protein EH220_02985 [bacterium]
MVITRATATINEARARTRTVLLDGCFPKTPLTYQEFAEKHVRLATGPFKNLPFRCDRQPFTALLFREFDRGWPTVYVTGPSQSSKTLSGFVIPTLRDACELQDDVIIGCPEADMADDKWQRDFVPTLESSPDLRWLIPQKGPGSRGGTVKDRITLGNGVPIKIMTCGGQDTSVAGYTSPNVRLTEAAGWSKNKDGSVEADRIRQIMARLRAFKRRERSIIVEGTVTVEEELPWRARGDDDDARLISTRSKIVCPCPHCSAWIAPEREHLVGWKDAESEDQAADQAIFICPECGMGIDDGQRRIAMADCRLVHWGQEVTPAGDVVGAIPPVSVLWFRWTTFNNLLLDAADTAVDEWRADQIEEGTIDRENAERELCQFCHAIPFRSKLADNEPLKPQTVRKRLDRWQRGLLPFDTRRLTIGVDIGKWTAWWFAIAFRESGQLHAPAYGAFDVLHNKSEDLSSRIVASLTEFKETIVEEGFAIEGKDGLYIPDTVWIDCGWRPDDVATFIRSAGRFKDNKFRAVRGRGRSTNNGMYSHKRKQTVQYPWIGTEWYAEINYKRRVPEFTFNADYWKIYVHDRLRTKVGGKGSLTFFRKDMENEHAKVSHHLCSEQFRRRWDPKKGLVDEWVKHGDNHWLDAATMACAAADYLGYKLQEIECLEEPDPVEVPEPDNWYAKMRAEACC